MTLALISIAKVRYQPEIVTVPPSSASQAIIRATAIETDLESWSRLGVATPKVLLSDLTAVDANAEHYDRRRRPVRSRATSDRND